MNPDEKIDIDIFKVVTKAVSESEDLEDIPSRICQLLVAALEIKACSMFLLNKESGELERVSAFGLSADYIGKGPVDATKSSGCTQIGKPVIISDVKTDTRVQYPEAAVKEGIAAILSIPIVFQNKVIGTLRLYDREKWHLSDRDLDSLLLLSEIIGLALRYSNLHGALRVVNGLLKELDVED